jgi:hypothetical protein
MDGKFEEKSSNFLEISVWRGRPMLEDECNFGMGG